jgi:SAM-dependent methyltransferase
MGPDGGTDVKRAFDAAAAGYDGLRRQLIPCFDDFYGAAIDMLGFPDGAAPRVLDLGAGTGLLAERLLARWPQARLVLVDLSLDMLARAGERFAGSQARVEIRAADYLRDPLGGPFDAQLSWLRRAGYVDVDCGYKWLHFAVFGGRRPPVRRGGASRRRTSPRPRPRSGRRRAGA